MIPTDKIPERGPFDIIGDLHGCAYELEELLSRLGYTPSLSLGTSPYTHPDGRKAVFVGDLGDRGPRIVDTIRIVYSMVMGGTAHCVPGNHDFKLLKKLQGKNINISKGLAMTLEEIDAIPESERDSFKASIAAFFESMANHLIFDDGKLVVAHAGIKEEMFGKTSGKVRDFALYGDTTGESDEYGLPIRGDWAADYRGSAMVVYGHTPVAEAVWVNNTVNIDTGCVFGGKLTALRYPEREFVSVPARQTYFESKRPFPPK